ncbi:putative carboxylesterase 18 [Canna indica]|uniref:Carboxylesterase 18 n=1 Tax=Canna indica TaxID=4628 RepID=A0AAQ3KSQ1_9LILI|nr:putative carboxylesterase 18 [Canna indica]
MTDESISAKPHRAAVSRQLPWKTRLYTSLLTAVIDASCRSNGTVNRLLFSLFDVRSSASAKPARGVRTADVTVDSSRNLWFRLFLPSSSSSGAQIPVFVFFHGGGFAFMSPASRAYDDYCRRVCHEVEVAVVSVNYRLSPENRYPSQYEDGLDVLRFLDGGGLATADPTAADLDLSSCFLVGDSAGGNIVHHVARRWAADAGQGGWKSLQLAGMVLIQPYFGGEERTEAEVRLAGAPMVSVERTDWLWRAFLPEGADRDHEAVNVFGPRATGELEAALPEAMLVVGGFDPLQDWQRRYYEGMTTRGKAVRLLEYPDAIHGFYAFPELKQSEALIEEMKAFVEAHRSPPN